MSSCSKLRHSLSEAESQPACVGRFVGGQRARGGRGAHTRPPLRAPAHLADKIPTLENFATISSVELLGAAEKMATLCKEQAAEEAEEEDDEGEDDA